MSAAQLCLDIARIGLGDPQFSSDNWIAAICGVRDQERSPVSDALDMVIDALLLRRCNSDKRIPLETVAAYVGIVWRLTGEAGEGNGDLMVPCFTDVDRRNALNSAASLQMPDNAPIYAVRKARKIARSSRGHDYHLALLDFDGQQYEKRDRPESAGCRGNVRNTLARKIGAAVHRTKSGRWYLMVAGVEIGG